MLRVAHLTPATFEAYVGGGERYVANVVAAVGKAAARMAVAVEQRIITIGREHADKTADGIRIVSLPEDRPTDLMSKTSVHLRAGIRDADVVHIHQSMTVFGLHALIAAKSQGIPAVGTDLGGGENAIMMRAGLGLLDGAISISSYAERMIKPQLRCPSDVIIGPIDTGLFSPGLRRQSEKLRRLVAVGRLLPHKGIDVAIRALPAGVQLRIVGKSYDERYLKDLRWLARGKDVVFLSQIDTDGRLIDEYRQADAFVQCSTYSDMYGNQHPKAELMGFSTMEAMACGLPVFVADCASLPELIGKGESGETFKSQEELAALLSSAALGRMRLQSMSSAARERAVRLYDHGVIGRSFIATYQRCAARRVA